MCVSGLSRRIFELNLCWYCKLLLYPTRVVWRFWNKCVSGNTCSIVEYGCDAVLHGFCVCCFCAFQLVCGCLQCILKRYEIHLEIIARARLCFCYMEGWNGVQK